VIRNETTGEEVYNGMVPASQKTVEVSVTGYGKMTYEVTVDGIPYYSTGFKPEIDFDAG
jgi:hypothetical protein